MIKIVCGSCQKPLSLDETKLPMKEVSFPCPSCNTQLTFDPRTPAAERPLLSVPCSSCKTGLEIEVDSLSSREPTSLKCPSCGVTLTIDKRKLQAPLLKGPVVKVAAKGYVPLPVASAADLAPARETGEYARLVAELYAGAENYLETCTDIAAREQALNEAQRRGAAALQSLGVAIPAPADDDARDAIANPELRTVDGKLITQSSYLQQVSVVSGTAQRLHPRLRAPQSYGPLVEWQREAYSKLSGAYEAAVVRSPQLVTFVGGVRDADDAYAPACARHQTDRQTLVGRLARQAALITKLETEVTSAEEVVNRLENGASAKGRGNLAGGGCISLVVAVILGGMIGGTAHSEGLGLLVALLAIAGGLYAAYHIGYAQNERERSNAARLVAKVRDELGDARKENDSLTASLTKHIAMAPDAVEAVTPFEPWALMTAQDFDERRDSLVFIAPSPRHAIGRSAAPMALAEASSTPIPTAMSAAAASPQMTVAVGATTARAVGFKPGGITPPPTEVAPTVEPSSATDAAARPHTRRNVLIGIGTGVVIVAVLTILWTKSLSFSARMERALDHNDIFTPAGTSVYDLYTREVASNPSSSMLPSFRPRIRERIEPGAEDAFARWYKDSDDTVGWESLERTYGFLELMFPEVAKYKTRKLYAVAQRAIDARDYVKAISSYEEALKLDPSWVLALNGLGKVYMIDSSPIRNDRLGVDYYERAVAADSGFTWAAKNLGDYYLRNDQYPFAERYLLKALATSPQRPSILRALGYICKKTHRSSEAIQYYQRSMLYEKDPLKNAAAQKAIDTTRAF
jgi:predicted RNA-binding Zn-ribbon protein involved in translation (DUF1610 family)